MIGFFPLRCVVLLLNLVASGWLPETPYKGEQRQADEHIDTPAARQHIHTDLHCTKARQQKPRQARYGSPLNIQQPPPPPNWCAWTGFRGIASLISHLKGTIARCLERVFQQKIAPQERVIKRVLMISRFWTLLKRWAGVTRIYLHVP